MKENLSQSAIHVQSHVTDRSKWVGNICPLHNNYLQFIMYYKCRK